MTLIDSEQRSQATDPYSSFIVQAPAGSGKTEILTQRYLRLLSTVTAPEQIIALTFTRKAASEMRERILLALQKANAGEQGATPHQQLTLSYAREALHYSQKYKWDLLQQPNRLKIITIDSLCQSINQSIPLLEKHIPFAQITNLAKTYYLNAARQCIQYAMETPQYQDAIKKLLLHVDNKQARLIELFKSLLSHRDQWLSLLFQAKSQDKEVFEKALQYIQEHELTRFKKSLPEHVSKQLIKLSRELATIENNSSSPRYILKNWLSFNASDSTIASALCKTILTGDNRLRKSFDHHVGLTKASCAPDEYLRLKTESEQLLSALLDFPEFIETLIQVSQLPEPQYDPEQWEILQALFLLLPLLVGHLEILFHEHNEVDFISIAQQALAALGDEENPTDLTLYLDNAIHHLLIDEFQDTSITQFELISKLIQGWSNNEGKTLFVVGDPMQSIYRFRQAEVGLFYRAKELGIGPITLTPLELKCNFRSSETLVTWVNHRFAFIFPHQSDMESGAVSFHPSDHVIKGQERSMISSLTFQNKNQEAEHLVQLIQHELEVDENQSLAILVRSRSQLREIIKILRQYQIPYQGTDIDLLTKLPHLNDAWSLTQCLLFPGNRLSWLAVLRSPYCGLNLTDIHQIAQFDKKKSIYHALLNLDKIQDLSEEGKARSYFFIQVLHEALSQRYQKRLSEWVIQTLNKLHCDRILNQKEQNDLEQLWGLLDRHEEEGRLSDINVFLDELNQLYSQQASPSRLQIMTIHKAKGLEFDTVFLPGLGAQANRGDSPILRWLKLPTQNEPLFLISPIKGSHQDQCALYDYLNQIDEEKEAYEAQRLLYVAVTRAKSRLYLLDHSTKTNKSSFKSLLSHQEFQEMSLDPLNETTPYLLPNLTRLPIDFYHTPRASSYKALNEPAKVSSSTNRLIGIVAHQLLNWICISHPLNLGEIPWDMAKNEFLKLGFDKAMLEDALFLLKEQITDLYTDKIGSWIISKHLNEKSEYEVLVSYQGRLVTRIIDRCFEENKLFWIIDFKTGKEDISSLSQHQKQLNEYGLYLSSRTNLQIHCGLYYLANSHWVSWKYEKTLESCF